MKVEKINENKIKITLTFEELRRREISLNDIEDDSKIAKELFINLIEESNLEYEFPLDDAQLFIEASSDNNNLFIVTITKIEDLPDFKKYALLEEDSKKIKSKSAKRNSRQKDSDAKYSQINYKVDSIIYSFKHLDDILDMCHATKNEKMFFGKNSLYKFNDLYYLVFSKSSVKNTKFLKTFVFLSEYCVNYHSNSLMETLVKERSKLIIDKNALQKLQKI